MSTRHSTQMAFPWPRPAPRWDSSPTKEDNEDTTLYIDGQRVPAQQGGTHTITCPADEPRWPSSPGPAQHMSARIASPPRLAFDHGRWSGVPAPERGAFLPARGHPAARARADEFALVSPDTGKRIEESQQDMVYIAGPAFHHFGRIAADDAGRVVDAGDRTW
ncbi:hypothetical protein QJS66_08885 [Kocuria rhizophila]|nr:hypothetical protein QJS66_08885 [Kocuria rhizophila]